MFIRGLNLKHNHDLKNLFKSEATTAAGSWGAARLHRPNESDSD